MDNLACENYGDKRVRQELLDGKVFFMSASPVINHGIVARRITRLFEDYLQGKECVVLADPTDVCLSDKDRVVPDVLVVCDRGKIRWGAVYGAPDLVVEVLSPNTERNDLGYKMRLYAKHGVKEYWIVSITDRSVKVYLPSEGVFELTDIYRMYPSYELDEMTEEEKAGIATGFSPFLFPDMRIALDEVFGGMLEFYKGARYGQFGL